MKHRQFDQVRSFKELVFTATGRDIDLKNVTGIDLYDNLVRELDRLKALASLLESAEDELDGEVVSGIGLLLKDVEKRARVILEAFDRCRSRVRDKP